MSKIMYYKQATFIKLYNPDLYSNIYVNINIPNARKKMLVIINKHNVIDIYQHFHTITRRYTWRWRHPIKQARLDYFIGSSSLSDLIQTNNIEVVPRVGRPAVMLSITKPIVMKKECYYEVW